MSLPRISEVRYARATPEDRATGLLGFISCTVGGGLRLDGITLRRNWQGMLYLSFPAKGPGRKHPFIEPTSRHARHELERAVLEALGVDAEGAP